MTILWGAYVVASGIGMRVGCETIVQPVTNASTQVNVTVRMYTQNRDEWPANDAQSLDYGPDMTGSTAFTNSPSNGTAAVLRDTRTFIRGYTAGAYGPGSSPGTFELGAVLSGAFNGITPSKRNTVTLPNRPYALPAPPTALAPVRNSDSQVTLTWTRHNTAAAPYTNQTVQERKWDKVGTWEGWTDWYTVGTAGGTASTATRTNLETNHVYQYRIRANNSIGSSTWNTSSTLIYMTPAAPSGVVSRTNTAGTQITTTWTDNAYTYGSTVQWKIQRSVAGGAYADLATITNKATLTYTDTSPGATSNRYRVAAYQTNGPLTSAYATGNLVTPAPPLAPTLLSPNGQPVDFNTAVTFTWQHNPGTDGALQSAFTIEYSANSGTSWVALPGATNLASTVSAFVVPAGTLTNGVNYLWRVRTVGVTARGFGPNSASATVIGYDKPTVTITSPDTPVTSLTPMTVSWLYSQAQGSAQASYTVTLLDATGATQYEQQTGTGTATSVTLATVLENGQNYLIRVSVVAANGVASNVAELTTMFVLIPPADAVVTGAFDPCTASVDLSLAPGTVIPGTNVTTDSVTIERRADQGDWVTLGIGILLPSTFTDSLPVTNGINEYRVTSASDTGATSAIVYRIDGTDGTLGTGRDPLWVWISYGDSFGTHLRFHGDVDISETSGRERATQQFLGRPKPVAYVGANTTLSVSASGALFFDRTCLVATSAGDCTYDSSPREWRLAGTDSEIVCYRDFTGRRIFGTISDVQTTDGAWPGKAAVSFVVEQSDFTERYVRLVSSLDTDNGGA